ncbi:hypothetical protein G6F22_014109 [Rhizopus arrhizus]|nr:hypothetical protein G6F22_014109 [Rhizopus arrhizus]
MDEIAVLQQGHAAADGVALDRGDDRHLRRGQGPQERQASAVARAAFGLEVAQVVAGREVFARTGEDHRRHRQVGRRQRDLFGQGRVRRRIQRVVAVLAIDGQRPGGQLRARFVVLAAQRVDDLAGGFDAGDAPHALARAPDVFPRLDPGRTEVGRAAVRLRQVARIQPGGRDAGLQVVAGNAGEERGVEDVGRAGLDDGGFVAFAGIGFFAGDEARAHVGEVSAHGQRRQHVCAGRDGARQDQRAVIEAAHFGYQREGAQRAGMAACACADQDQPVHAGFQRLFGVADGGDVVEHLAAPVVHAFDQVAGGAQAGPAPGGRWTGG